MDPRLTDGSTHRLFALQTSLAAKFRFDLQPENQPTDRKKPQNGRKTAGCGLIGVQCIVGQWGLDLQTFRPAATVPIRINSVSRGSTVPREVVSAPTMEAFKKNSDIHLADIL